MKIEHQVSSFAPSQRLKELGVKQNAHWHWEIGLNGIPVLTDFSKTPHPEDQVRYFSAFSVAELGEMLPSGCKSFVGSCGINSKGEVAEKNWVTEWHGAEYGEKKWSEGSDKFASTEADARAKMLIYLIENGFVNS